MNITKQEALNKIEELKKFVGEIDAKKEEKVICIAIKNRWTGEIIFQSTKTTYKEAIVEKGDANLYDADLYDANLCDADLCGADLCGANLCGANLCDADLCGANLCGANLCGANLCGANLYGANLRDADLRSADLRDANLYGANLRDAELCNAKFYGRGGTKKLKQSQLTDFLNALGFQVE